MTEFAYPSDLARDLRDEWAKLKHGYLAEIPPQLPSDAVLHKLLGLSYQLSLLKEEGRQLRFRLLFRSKTPNKRGEFVRRALFVEELPATLPQLKKLISCAPFERTLIGIGQEKGPQSDELSIHGLYFDDSTEWDMLDGKAYFGRPLSLSNELVITATGPAKITVSCGPLALLRLHEGTIRRAGEDVFWSNWLVGFFSPYCIALKTKLQKDFENNTSETHVGSLTDQVVSTVVLTAIRGLVAGTKYSGHGGALAFVPRELAPGGSLPWLSSSIELNPSEHDPLIGKSIFAMLFTAVQRPNPFGPPRWTAEDDERYFSKPLDFYQFMFRLETPDDFLAQRTKQLQSAIASVAALTQVDGLTILDTELRALRFACIVSPTASNLTHVVRASTADETRGTTRSLKEFGARHQSMFRLCQMDDRILGVVVSQDGDVRLVKRVGDSVVYWDQTSNGIHSP